MRKKIKLHRDGGITIYYGEIEKFGMCFNDLNQPCGTWCPLFPALGIYVTDITHSFLNFKCHGGDPIEIDCEVEE